MPDIIDLSRNEGRPPPRDCFDVLERHGTAILQNYVDGAQLEAAYASYLGIDPVNVLATTGADDAIDRVIRAFLAPGQEMVFTTPTFEMLPAFARMVHGRLVPIEYEWGALPNDRILAQVNDRTGIVAVITPDNPTGHAFTARELLGLANSLPSEVVLLVDAAYAEFAEEDHTRSLVELPSVLVTRTLSKAWGLAGLRVGFVAGAQKRVDTLRDTGGPYPLAGPSVAIALDRLQNGIGDMRGFVDYVNSRRNRLAEMIRSTGGDPLPSQANFVFSRFPDACWIKRGLAAQGVLVRHFPHLSDHVRITVPRNDTEMCHVERALGCLAWRGGSTGTRPEALLFDMDGVLADVRRSYRETIVRTCAAFGVVASRQQIETVKLCGRANDDWAVTHDVLARAGVEVSPGEVTKRFEEIYQGTAARPGLRRHETLFPSRELLKELARSFKLGIVTGRPRDDARRFLQEQDIVKCFSAVVCREDGPLKPDPGPVNNALVQLEAKTAWMLGDTPDDIWASIGAGVVPIGVIPPDQSEEETESVRSALDDAGAALIVKADDDFGGLFNG